MPDITMDYVDGDLRLTISVDNPDRQRVLEYAVAFLKCLPDPELSKEPSEE